MFLALDGLGFASGFGVGRLVDGVVSSVGGGGDGDGDGDDEDIKSTVWGISGSSLNDWVCVCDAAITCDSLDSMLRSGGGWSCTASFLRG